MPEDIQTTTTEAGGGGGGGGDDAALLARIQKAVDEATTGLKRTNNELKGEKTTIKEQFDAVSRVVEELGGIDMLKGLGDAETIRNMSEMRKRFQADEQGKLLADGKYDEWFDRRTAALRKDHENQNASVKQQMEVEKKRADAAEAALQRKVLEIDASAACTKLGVEPSAIQDVRLRAEREFSFDTERQRFVMKDDEGGVVFGKDGATPKTIEEWIEDQKETSRHWWPASRGSGADGSLRPGDKGALEKLDMRAYSEARKKQGFRSF